MIFYIKFSTYEESQRNFFATLGREMDENFVFVFRFVQNLQNFQDRR